jgi:hypothetical protein
LTGTSAAVTDLLLLLTGRLHIAAESRLYSKCCRVC